MKKLRLALVCTLVLALSLGSVMSALADVMLTNGQQTAYIGADDYLYLVDANGGTKVMRTAVTDIVAMNETMLYCLANGALYQVKLDGSASSIVSSQPTEELLNSIRVKNFTLTEGVLTHTQNGQQITVASNVLYAAQGVDALYYLETTDTGVMLKQYPLTVNPLALPATTLIGPAMVPNPIALAASENAVVILGENGMAAVVNLTTGTYRFLTFTQTDIAMIAVLGDQVLYYTQDAQGVFHYAGQMTEGTLATATPVVITPVPVTPAPTVRPTATPYVYDDESDEDDEPTYTAVKHGQSGSRVYNMQKRLIALGYPVGNADGSFGNQTLRALKLFQGDAGYTERTTATSALLSKLYSSSAPEYNEYKTRRVGNKGERVLMIQERLNDLGYNAGAEDGSYGKTTEAAVKAFQTDNGLQVDGVAGPATLKKLYASSAQAKPTATPTAAPTAKPTAKPNEPTATEQPDNPTPTPTPTPTPVPEKVLKLGDRSDEVKELNVRLAELGYLKDYNESGSDANLFTEATQEAVNAFANMRGITADGTAYEELLEELYKSSAPTAAPDAATCGLAGHTTSDNLDHTAAACGKSGHYNCDGKTHTASSCGLAGHYLCEGDDHSAAACRVAGHY
ncbi:MAG: peptidoglycan-binding protein, partial [Clostridia bacterium]|nr:peptidoglycan-binding protein [Clostridia bacterium]